MIIKSKQQVFLLSADEVKAAIWSYLKAYDTRDRSPIEMPDDYHKLQISSQDDGLSVAIWIDDGERYGL